MAPILTPALLRAARGLLDWTQDDLGRAAGLSRSTVRDFAKGRHALHRATEQQILSALGAADVEILQPGAGGPGVRLRQESVP